MFVRWLYQSILDKERIKPLLQEEDGKLNLIAIILFDFRSNEDKHCHLFAFQSKEIFQYILCFLVTRSSKCSFCVLSSLLPPHLQRLSVNVKTKRYKLNCFDLVFHHHCLSSIFQLLKNNSLSFQDFVALIG